jgi:putative nucleotidyltransferase with HDIG domain
MQGTENGVADPGARKQVREYFREVSERCKLPPLPAVVAAALRMVRDPDVNTAKLCRVLSDDAAVAGRLFTVSRSAFYGRYSPPKTLVQAVQILGLRTVQRILVASTAQSLCQDHSEVSEALWTHSLAAALTAELLARQAGSRELESAFMAGLLHDVGEMVLLHGDPKGFKQLARQVQQDKIPLLQAEKETYGSDHTLIGVVLMDCWNFDEEIGNALVSHHDDTSVAREPSSLAALLRVTDYLASLAGFGFLCEVPAPPAQLLDCWGGGDQESLLALVEQVRQAVDAEKALYA